MLAEPQTHTLKIDDALNLLHIQLAAFGFDLVIIDTSELMPHLNMLVTFLSFQEKI